MRNIAFSTILRLGERQWEFNFRKLPGEEALFHADVTDTKGNRLVFTMYRDPSGAWRASGTNLPLWITAGEEALGKAIIEGMERATVL
jgi:hypothetical protein